MTTLPTIAGETRIHSLPNRPPFMLLPEIAGFLNQPTRNVQRQFKRNMHSFPKGSWFLLTPDEYREKSATILQTSQGMRTDVEQYGLTETGVLYLTRFLKGNDADAAAAALITSIMQRHEAERDAMRRELAVDRDAYLKARRIRSRIMTAAAEGWSYTTLRERFGYSNPELVTEVQAIRARGYIPFTAVPVPQYILRKLADNKAWLDDHAEDTRQLLLGLEA
jgi:hypothetical protein